MNNREAHQLNDQTEARLRKQLKRLAEYGNGTQMLEVARLIRECEDKRDKLWEDSTE